MTSSSVRQPVYGKDGKRPEPAEAPPRKNIGRPVHTEINAAASDKDNDHAGKTDDVKPGRFTGLRLG